MADGQDYMGRMGDVTAALEKAKLELREAENSRDALKRQIVGEEPVLLPDAPGTAANVVVPEIDGRIDALKRNLDSLLQRFTDKHPDVVGVRRMIQELEEQKRAEVAARKKMAAASPASVTSTNPVYQQLKISLAESEANVASLRVRVDEYQRRYNSLKDMTKMIPQIEAELSQLNRDYEINKKNYESLVGRRESAAMSGEMDATSAGVDFRLIDPPRVAPKPVYPNRLLLLPLTLVLALAAGLVFPLAASQIRPVFFDARSLREATGLPLLGLISKKTSDEEIAKNKRSLKLFIAAFALLLAVYGAGAALMVYFAARTA